MNLDYLLIDIIKDKSKGNFGTNLEELQQVTGKSKEEILGESIEKWFGIKPGFCIANLTKTSSKRNTIRVTREILPFYSQVRPKLYLYFLKINDREAILSNSDD